MNSFKLLLLSMFCFHLTADAQIFVGPSGTAVISFDALSVLPSTEWSTWTNGGINGSTYTTTNDVIAGVATNYQSLITNTLERISANNVSELARHNTAGGY